LAPESGAVGAVGAVGGAAAAGHAGQEETSRSTSGKNPLAARRFGQNRLSTGDLDFVPPHDVRPR
jgi:hypothetical protein